MSIVNQPLAFVDVETNGGSYYSGRVIEIGIIRVENSRVVREYRQLINPGRTIPPEITRLTGIKNEDLINQPEFSDIAREILEILEGCIFIAHHVRFDHAFISKEFERSGIEYDPKLLCTVRLSRNLFPQERHHSLDKIISRFSLQVSQRHRAYDDALALWQFYQVVLSNFDLEVVDAAVDMQFKRQSLPPYIDSELVTKLPRAPGVYIFEGEKGAPLYVGKSTNIRQRVMSHFTDDRRRYAELRLAKELKNIRYIRTHGELGALITESRMVKELLPLHNRQLRRQSEMTAVVQSVNEDGYDTAYIAQHEKLTSDDLRKVIGVYRSQRRAKEHLLELSKTFDLCNKLLGLEKSRGACFGSQLKSCHGACVGREQTIRYNLRFAEAFAHARIQQWPFGGPIAITEKHPELEGSATYIFDNWCFMAEISESGYQERAEIFDIDLYRILRQYISKPENQKRIRTETAPDRVISKIAT